MTYRKAAVASNFSPTFSAVLAEADRFATHCGATLDIIHVAPREQEKERRFFEALGRETEVHWLESVTPGPAIAGAAKGYGYDLLIAGALHREDGERPFTSGVARDLLRRTHCDLLLLPRPTKEPQPLAHVVFALEPRLDVRAFVHRAVEVLQPQRITIVTPVTPFAAAIAASMGEKSQSAEDWLDLLAADLAEMKVEVETRAVTSNTGYNLCDTIEGLEADLLVIKAGQDETAGPLSNHMNWLYQVVPTRLLVVRSI